MDDTKVDLRDIRWGGINWIGLAQEKYEWKATGKKAT
jgi:hypothetical protein